MPGTSSAMESHAHTPMAWVPALQIRKLRLKQMRKSPINHRTGEGQRWDSGSCGKKQWFSTRMLALGGNFNRVHRQFSCHSLRVMEV